jgi:predicted XRE-type DNA-binding protein
MAIKTKEAKTASDTAKKSLKKEAEKVIDRIKASGLRHDHIATAINVEKSTFSRFMNLHDSYITRSMIDRINVFLNK